MQKAARSVCLSVALCCCLPLTAAETPGRAAATLGHAHQELDRGNYAAAYRETITWARSAGRRNSPATAWELLAKVCYRSGMFDDAVRYGRRYLEFVDRLAGTGPSAFDDSRQQVAIDVAESYAALDQADRAATWFKYALAVPHGKRIREPTWEGNTRLRLAAAIKKKSPDEARAICQDVAASAKRLLDASDLDQSPEMRRAAATELFVRACRELGHTKDAEQLLLSVLAKQAERPNREEILLQIAELRAPSTSISEQLQSLHDTVNGVDPAEATAQQAEFLERVAKLTEQQARREPARSAEILEESRQEFEKAARCWEKLCGVVDVDAPLLQTISHFEHWFDLLVRQGQWNRAREAAEELLKLRRTALLPGDPAIYRTETALGVCAAKCADYPAATRHLNAARTFWEKYRPRVTSELNDTLQSLAEVAREEGHYDRALVYLDGALQALAEAPDDVLSRIGCRIGRANVLSAKGDYKTAVHEYDLAETAARSDEVGFQRLRALALLGRAAVYKTQGRFDGAIEDCRAALEVYGRFPEIRQLDDVPCLAMLATLHLARYENQHKGPLRPDDLAAARRYLDLAEERSGGSANLPPAQRCQLLHVGGLISFRESQSHFRSDGDKQQEAAAAACERALRCWSDAAELARETKLQAVQARAQAFWAEAQLFRVDFLLTDSGDAASQALEQACDASTAAILIAERLQAFPGIHYRALLSRAKILGRQAKRLEDAELLKSQKAQRAVADLQAAVEVVERPRTASLGADAERAEFFSQFIEAYELLIGLLVEQGDFERAVAYSQISRNRTFIEQVKVPQNGLRAELAGGNPKALDELNRAIETYDRLRQDVQRRANAPLSEEELSNQQALIERFIAAQRECDRLAAKVRQLSPSYHKLLHRGLTIDDWAPARDRVLGTDGLLLVYHVGPGSSQLFVVAPGEKVECHPLLLTSEAAEELGCAEGSIGNTTVNDLVIRCLSARRVQGVQRGSETSRAAVSSGRVPGGRLTPKQAVRFAEVVLPETVRSLIRRKRPGVVTVVADGSLHRFPLEALALREDAYLLDDPNIPPIEYAPSVMVMAALREREAASAEKPPSLLTIGDPVNPLRPDDPERAKLARAKQECDHWSECFRPLGDVASLLGPEATERNFRQYVPGKRFVHCAVHGKVDEQLDTVFAAELVFSVDATVPGDEGLLDLQEVYGLDLKDCELTVLSACNSNIGANRKLEAGSTLTRAFLSAGTRRVVSSLWKVEDESASVLMSRFAEQIAGSLESRTRPNYAAALQDARRHVRQTKDWSDPHYWAPFVLIGPAN
jgi:hypothetical protein